MDDFYIVFDLETTGLPKKRYAPLDDFDNWPNIVQFAWGVYNKNNECMKIKDYIIKPNNFIIPDESIVIHKITNEAANELGVDLNIVMQEFMNDISDVKYLVAHNLSFDFKVLCCELLRNSMNIKNLNKMKKICTMETSTNFCKMGDFKYGKYKWPKLSELYFKLFNCNKEGLHNARVDIETCQECFTKLLELSIIEL